MTNEEIVKNAPDWATHWAVNGEYNEYAAIIDGKYLDMGAYDTFVKRVEIKPCYGDLWTFTPLDELKTTESVYTQEMKDNGEPVKVGMKCKVVNKDYEISDIAEQFINREVEIKALFKGKFADLAAVEMDSGTCQCFRIEMIAPIKSEREEAEEALIKKVAKVMLKDYLDRTGSHGGDYTIFEIPAKKLLEAGLLAEIILPLKRS